jgi:DNA-directed RNA polymerase II subunit RPB9
VLYQDQSKRKETRMILFYVCVKCNHSFTDPTLPSDSMRVDTAEDG